MASGWSRTAAHWLSATCLLLFACAGARQAPPAVFPSEPVTAVLPIRDPISGPELEVEAELWNGGRRVRSWMVVDSGASGVSITEEAAQALGVYSIGTFRSEGVGGTADMRAIRIEMSLGALEVSEVIASVSEQFAIIGQLILRHSPWEVSWSRGTLTLNAAPWTDRSGTTVVPLYPQSTYAVDDMQVRVAHRSQRMLLDTGAVVSTIPENFAEDLGLAPQAFKGTFAVVGGAMSASRAFVADVELGGLRVPGKRLVGLPNQSYGLFGRDLLFAYDFQVVPGKQVLLRPRADLRATARQRIGRWSWLPKCPTPGCVEARFFPDGRHGRLELSVEQALSRPVEVILTCPESRSEPVPIAVMMARGGLRARPNHVSVRLPAIQPGTASLPVPNAGGLWFSAAALSPGAGCEELTVLDVIPLLESSQPKGITAWLRP